MFDAACTPFNARLCLVRRIRLPLRNAMQPASCENSIDGQRRCLLRGWPTTLSPRRYGLNEQDGTKDQARSAAVQCACARGADGGPRTAWWRFGVGKGATLAGDLKPPSRNAALIPAKFFLVQVPSRLRLLGIDDAQGPQCTLCICIMPQPAEHHLRVAGSV